MTSAPAAGALVVAQSWRTAQPGGWLGRCLDSVRAWAAARGHRYVFEDDALFDRLPPWFRQRFAGCPGPLSDLARLLWVRALLQEGAPAVAWLDADVLVIDGPALDLWPRDTCLLGREVWVDHDPRGRLKAWRHAHNAVLVFRADNSFLDFYIESCLRMAACLRDGQGVPPQFLGPKLLTAFHNITGLPLTARVAMMSPVVAADVLHDGPGAALALWRRTTAAVAAGEPVAAVNLCRSLVGDDTIIMERLCDRLPAMLSCAAVVSDAAPMACGWEES